MIETSKMPPAAPINQTNARSADLIAAQARPSALACLDARMVEAVTSTAERAFRNPGMLLPATPAFAEQVDAVYSAARADIETGAEPAAIRDFLALFAGRRNLPVPSSLALDLDAATMAQWPQDLFVMASRLVWERFEELRVPNPPDFLGFIAEELAERRQEIAARIRFRSGSRPLRALAASKSSPIVLAPPALPTFFSEVR
jgi:hypothetical protein